MGQRALCASIVLAIGLSSFGSAQLGLDDLMSEPEIIYGQESAYQLMPAQVLGDGALMAEWSPNGRYFVFVEFDAASYFDRVFRAMDEGNAVVSRELLLPAMSPIRYWDINSSRVGTIDSVQLRESEFIASMAFAGSSRVLLEQRVGPMVSYQAFKGPVRLSVADFSTSSVRSVTVELPENAVAAYEGRVGLVETEGHLLQLEGGRVGIISVSRNQPVAYLQILNSTGQVETTWQGDLPDNFREAHEAWSANPHTVSAIKYPEGYYLWFQKLAYGDPVFLSIDKANERLLITNDSPQRPRNGDSPELYVREESFSRSEKNERVRVLRLTGSGSPPMYEGVPAALQDAEGTPVALGQDLTAFISPTNNAIALTGLNAGTTVRSLREVSPEFLWMIKRNEIITRALSYAKQTALAALMYAADHEDVLPGPDGVMAKIQPYLRIDNLGSAVNWLFEGGSQAEIESVATTPMLEIQLPWGRAVGYTDGHAEFHADE